MCKYFIIRKILFIKGI